MHSDGPAGQGEQVQPHDIPPPRAPSPSGRSRVGDCSRSRVYRACDSFRTTTDAAFIPKTEVTKATLPLICVR